MSVWLEIKSAIDECGDYPKSPPALC